MSFEQRVDGTTTMTYERYSIARLRHLALILALGVPLIQSCSSGSGGSEVGDAPVLAPTARIQVLNSAFTGVFREGSEVIVTGKASEDPDGPVLLWSWRQVSGPTVALIEQNSTTVSFTAPDVSTQTEVVLELTVEDSSGETGQTTVSIPIAPAQDADEFLSLDVIDTSNPFDAFEVIVALAENTLPTGATPKPFTFSARAYLVYPPHDNPQADCSSVDPLEYSAGLPQQTSAGCYVELLEDLTPAVVPGGGTGITGEWPAGVPLLADPDLEWFEQWWNPRYTLKIPRVDADDFNQPLIDQGARGRILDAFNASNTTVLLAFELTAPENQQDATLILPTAEEAPVGLPSGISAKFGLDPINRSIVTNAGVGLPTEAIVDLAKLLAEIDGRESTLTSEFYYRSIDPDGRRDTLNKWLLEAGFASDDRGTLLPEAVAGSDTVEGIFAHAIYLNNYDLGFGRNMFSRTDEFGNVYSFVVNHATLEGAIRRLDSIVTVVMEYSPADSEPLNSPDKFVKFYTFIEDGSGDSRRISTMDFDGRGERFTPGNCVACHGGVNPPGFSELFVESCGNVDDLACYTWPDDVDGDGNSDPPGDLAATFLPWDLQSLLYADTDPAITEAPLPFDGESLAQELLQDYGDFSRATQEPQLRKLNEAAYRTYLSGCMGVADEDCDTLLARQLVEAWYPNPGPGELLGPTFVNGVPEGWQNDAEAPEAEVLYYVVYAQHCRMCHTNIFNASLRFGTYEAFVEHASLPSSVFDRGHMPAARLTMDRFWAPGPVPYPPDVLAFHLGVPPEDAGGPQPQADIATPATAIVDRYDTIPLSADESTFANSFDWDLTFVPVPELAGTLPIIAYEPRSVGDGTPSFVFVPEHPGAYTARLTINGADPMMPDEGLSDVETVSVRNFQPRACDDAGAAVPGGASTLIAFPLNDRFRLSGTGLDCGDAGLIALDDGRDIPLFFDFGGGLGQATANGGTFTLHAGADCVLEAPAGCVDDTLEYEPSSSGDSYIDTISYVVTDIDGEVSAPGIVAVEVTANLVATPQAVSDPVSEIGREISFSVSGGALASPGQDRYTVTLTQAPARGTVSRGGVDLNQGAAFTTNGDPADLSFIYTSDAFETGAESLTFSVVDPAMSAAAAVLDFEVLPQAPFETTLDSDQIGAVMDQWTSTDGKADCTGCHGSFASPFFDLTSLDPDDVFADIQTKGLVDTSNLPDSSENSLILCYPSGQCDNGLHPPGVLPTTSAAYQIILRWIQEGAQNN
jgi:mono/diheme cytochrome c family protein